MNSPTTPSNVQRRLWKVVGILGLFIATLLVGNAVLPADKSVTRNMVGHDFLVFYTAGTFARQGEFAKLYDVDATNAFESATGRAAGLAIGKTYGPWWNPPFAAWALVPFSVLSFESALTEWWICGAVALAGAVLILRSFFPAGTRWHTWALVGALTILSGPFWGVFTHGQNTFISLLILSATVALWRSRHGFAAGLVGALLLYKPQLGAVIGAAMVLTLGWRALAGYAVTGGALLAVTIFTMPGMLSLYIHHLPQTLAAAQTLQRYFWERHVTLKAFWRLFLQGWAVGPMNYFATSLWLASELALGACLTLAALAVRRDASRLDRFIAACIVAMPLLMPFYFDYDLLLLAVAGTLCASDAIRTGNSRAVVAGWVVLDLSLFFSTQLASATSFILAVPVLAGVSLLLIARTVMIDEVVSRPIPLPAQASRALAA